jgi:hypothetical protein
MFADDETKLAKMIADLERIRKLLRDSDAKAEECKLTGALYKPPDCGQKSGTA